MWRGARGAVWAAVIGFAVLVASPALAQTTYTWNKTASASWTTAANWTPSRTTPATSDILVFNGTTTATAVVTGVPTQTIGRLRFINNVNVSFEAGAAVTLTITGGAAPNLDLTAGSTLTLTGNGNRPITLNHTGSSTGTIAGSLVFNNMTHSLLAATANAVQFTGTGSLTTGSTYTGNAFGTTGTANVVVFQSGATYTHNGGNNPFGLAAPNSRVTFSPGSVQIWRANAGFTSDGRTYGDLTVQNNTALSGTGAGNFAFGTLTLESGSSFTHTGSGTGSVTVRGNLLAAGTGGLSITPGSGGILFNVAGLHTIGGGGTGAVTFGGSGTVGSGAILAVQRPLAFSAGALTVNGTFRIEEGGNVTGGSAWTYGAGDSLVFANTTGPLSVPSTANYWPAASGPANVFVQGAGGISLGSGATRTVSTLSVSGPIQNAQLLTVNGTLQMNAGGSVTGAPTYGAASALLYLAGMTAGGEWTGGVTTGPGVPPAVTLQAGAGTVALPASNHATPGNLTITTGTLSLNAGGGELQVGGNWSNAGTFTPNDQRVVLAGAGTQTVTRAGGESFAGLALNKTGGSVVLGSALTITGTFSGTDLEFNGTTDALDLNGQTLTFSGTAGGTNANGALRGSGTSNLIVNGTGDAGTLRFAAGVQTLGQLTVNRTGAGANLTLGSALTVNGTLTLTSGTVTTTGTNVLTLGPTAALSRTSGWVVGRLSRRVATGTPTVAYPIGSSIDYLPATLTFAGVTVAGNVTAFLTAGDHPNLATSGLQTDHSVNRFLTLSNAGTTFTSYDATVSFAASDVDSGTVPDSLEVRRFSAGVWSLTGTGPRTATSTQALNLVGVGDLAVGEPAFHTVTATAGPNGTVSPLGAVQVKNGRSVTFTMTPDVGHHLDSLRVDGAFVGSTNPYTLGPVVSDRTFEATFAIDFYPVTVQTNGGGTVTVDPVQESYPYHFFLAMTATPFLGNRFVNWSDDVNTAFNPVGFNVDSTMNVVANFERFPLQYLRSTFTATYSQISTGTGATRLMNAADDSTLTVPLPFPFTFSGLKYTTANYLAVNANGFAYFSRAPVVASSPSFAANSNLFTANAPNGVLAPWYDDLAVGAIGLNPAGSVLYQTQGSVGSRTFTIQWTNVSSYNTATSGQPRRLNFQVILYEASQSVEFRYGTATGSAYSTFESASIGIEDSVGGNGNYIDGVTGSKVTNHGMMTSNKWPTRFLRFAPDTTTTMAGSYTVGVGGNYPNLNEAFADLNHRGVGAPVTLMLTDALYDSSASTGRNSFPLLLGPIPFSDAVRPVTIQGNGSTVIRFRGTDAGNCGNQSIINAIATTNEPILGLIGADHVTLKDLSLEGGLLVDRGVLLLPSSTGDGSQNNRLETIAVTLNRANTSSIGIAQGIPTTPTGPAGTNSSNRYYNLNVRNCYAGVSLAGNASVFDDDNVIDVVNGGSTVIGGGFLGDLGNGTPSTFGIRASNQSNFRVMHCDVNSALGIGTGTIDGIVLDNPSASALSNGTCEIAYNAVRNLSGVNSSAGRVSGIRVNQTSHPASVTRIYNNFVHDLNTTSTATASRRLVGLFAQDAGNGAGSTLNIDFNTVRVQPSGISATNTCLEIGNAPSAVVNVRNNVLANFTGSQSASAKHYTFVTAAATGVAGPGSVSNRNNLHVNNSTNGFTGLASGDRITLADWQTATAGDANSSSSNPQFLASGNLHVNPSVPTPLESAGSFFSGAIDWVPNDIDNNVRNATTPDVGADEGAFQVLTTTDMAASSLVEPADGSTRIAGSIFSPQAVYENSGTSSLTNIPVRYRIRGPLPDTTIRYNQTFTIPSLGPGAGQTVTYPPTSISVGGTYQLQAITELAGDLNAANNILNGVLDVAGPLSGTYSIGTGQPAPFNSITNAIIRLNSVGVSGPVTLQLVSASYGAAETFPINVNAVLGGSAVNTVTIKPAAGVAPVISGSSNRALLVFNGADYVTLDGSNTPGGTSRDLTLQNLNNSTASAVLWAQTTTGADPATNLTFKNLVLIGNDNTQTLFGAGFGGSTIGTTSSGTGNHRNAVRNCDIRRVQYGIYTGGASAVAKNVGTVLVDNLIESAGADAVGKGGIFARFEDSLQVTHNRIGNITHSGTSAVFGVSLGLATIASTQWAGDEVTNATVTANRIRGISQTHLDGYSAGGIVIAQAATGVNTLVNNMITGVLSPANDPDFTVGILVGGGGGATRLYFNSVAMTGFRQLATAPSFALAIGGTNPIVDSRNNALFNSQLSSTAGSGYVIGLAYYGPYTNLTSNYNDLFSAAAQYAMVGGLTNEVAGDRVNIGDWRIETGMDANSIASDPLFVNSSNDLHIGASGSPLANIGTPIAGVTTDFDGETGARTTTPDIGADEFVTHTLTTQVVGVGTVSKNPDAPNYISGSSVQLTANAGANHHFLSWSGDLTGSANPATLLMDAPKSVTATFVLDSFSVAVAADSHGTAIKTPDQPLYQYGSTVTLTATAAPGYHFTQWVGDSIAVSNPLNLVVTRARSFTAQFAINTYSVALSTSGSGTAARSPDLAAYDHGSSVTLTATPGVGSNFIRWSGDTLATTNPLPLVVVKNRSIVAEFELGQYALTLASGGNGAVAKSPDQPLYPHGTEVTLTATPNVGYHFLSWSGDTASTDNPLVFRMVGPRSITGNFAVNQYTLAITPHGEGAVGRNPDLALYDHGSVVQLTATPSLGHTFLGWSGDTVAAANPLSLLIDGNTSLDAQFTVAVHESLVGSGTIARSPNQVAYQPGSVVQLTAVPSTGWHFIGWGGDTTTTTNPISLALPTSRSVIANFEINTYPLTVNRLGNGTAAKSPDLTSYTHGSLVQLTANPYPGHTFVRWTGDLVGSSNPVSVLMDSPKNIVAEFTFALDVFAGPNGTAVANPAQFAYVPGALVQLTATPNTGYHLVNWTGDSTSTANPLTILMNRDKVFTANFAINQYTLDVTTVDQGTVAKSPDLAQYAHGTGVTLTATPAAGYHFVGWTGDTTTTTNPLSFLMVANRTLTATFAINQYALSVTVGANGTVQRDPSQALYDHGTPVTVTATPDNGYHFVDWTGDTTTTTNPLSLVMTSPRSLTATFAINQYPLQVDVTGSGTVQRDPSLPVYDHGTPITLTATPGPGWHFLQWEGDTTTTANPLSFVMTGARNIGAVFEINTYALATSVTSGSGLLAREPDLPVYPDGTKVDLIPVAAPGWHFVGWGGDTTGTQPVVSVVMDGPKTFSVSFAINTYTLSLSTIGTGSIDRNPNQATYDHGTQVTLSAVTDTANHFVRWGGAASGTTTPVVITMTDNTSVSATFVSNIYDVNVVVEGQGNVTRNPNQNTAYMGSNYALSAAPTTGYQFEGWHGDITSDFNPVGFRVDSTMSIIARFVAAPPPVIVTSVIGSGTVTKDPDAPSYPPSSTVSVTAVPSPGWHFVRWTGSFETTFNPIGVFMDRDKNLTATFEPDGYTLTTNVIGGGAVARNPNQAAYPPGTPVLLTATADPGFHFKGWTGDTTTTANPLTVTMYAVKSVTAVFGHTLSLTAAAEGTLSMSPELPVYAPNDTVMVTPHPRLGWYFIGWTGDATGDQVPLPVVMSADKTIGATYANSAYQLSLDTVGNGSIARSPQLAAYPHGADVVLSAQPQSGWHFTAWSLEGSDVLRRNHPGDPVACDVCPGMDTNPLRLTMTSDRRVVAIFEQNAFALALSTQGEGTVNDAWVAQEGDDSTVVLTAEPREGWRFVGWRGTVESAANPLRVQLDDAAAFEATFEPEAAASSLEPQRIASPVTAAGALPTAFALTSVVPNPTIGPATVEFALPKSARITLSVHDVQGRVMAVLADGDFGPGRHHVVWDGRTAQGPATTGIYFVRYRTPAGVFNRRVALSR